MCCLLSVLFSHYGKNTNQDIKVSVLSLFGSNLLIYTIITLILFTISSRSGTTMSRTRCFKTTE
jgi:hypothetical protein